PRLEPHAVEVVVEAAVRLARSVAVGAGRGPHLDRDLRAPREFERAVHDVGPGLVGAAVVTWLSDHVPLRGRGSLPGTRSPERCRAGRLEAGPGGERQRCGSLGTLAGRTCKETKRARAAARAVGPITVFPVMPWACRASITIATTPTGENSGLL